MNELWTNIFGYSATICMVLGYLPQALATIRTRNTDGISLTAFVMLALGSIFFIVQGCMTANWPLVIANTITTVCSVIIFAIKIHNDYGKKRK